MKYFFIILSLIISLNSSAQFRSLLSANGQGRLNSSVFSSNKLCGELSAGYMNNLVINKQNPASYIQSSLTLIDIGVRAENGSFSLLDTVKSSGGITMSHIAFLFPLTPGKSGLSIGFTQNSSVNYSLKSLNSDALFGKYNQTQSGNGNTYNAYAGVGFKVNKFSFGSNLNFIFGNVKYNQDINFTDSSFMPTIRHRNDISMFNLAYDLGAQYYTDINKKNAISFGIYYKGNLSSTATNKYTRQSLQTVSSTSTNATVLEDSTYSVDLPKNTKIGFGVNYYANKAINIGTEFNLGFFDGYTDYFTGLPLQNTWHFHTGIEYRPILNRDIDSRKYFNKVTYRFGTILGKSEHNIEGSLNDFKIMGGISLPVLNRTVSQITIGLEYHKLGFSTDKNYGESLFTFHTQITFGDKWFIRPKFD